MLLTRALFSFLAVISAHVEVVFVVAAVYLFFQKTLATYHDPGLKF